MERKLGTWQRLRASSKMLPKVSDTSDMFKTASLHESQFSFINFTIEQRNIRVDRVDYSV
jgi:hypothetical protein